MDIPKVYFIIPTCEKADRIIDQQISERFRKAPRTLLVKRPDNLTGSKLSCVFITK